MLGVCFQAKEGFKHHLLIMGKAVFMLFSLQLLVTLLFLNYLFYRKNSLLVCTLFLLLSPQCEGSLFSSKPDDAMISSTHPILHSAHWKSLSGALTSFGFCFINIIFPRKMYSEHIKKNTIHHSIEKKNIYSAFVGCVSRLTHGVCRADCVLTFLFSSDYFVLASFFISLCCRLDTNQQQLPTHFNDTKKINTIPSNFWSKQSVNKTHNYPKS